MTARSLLLPPALLLLLLLLADAGRRAASSPTPGPPAPSRGGSGSGRRPPRPPAAAPTTGGPPDDGDGGGADDAEDAGALSSSSSSSSSLPSNPRPPPAKAAASGSSVTFLYEVYEHEVHSPKAGGWGSRRFTQSPTAGEGGRDSTSLDPRTCAPPRNYRFDGEWKIDVSGGPGGAGGGGAGARDGFGWEYYVGRYDGLGRRRRRWVRELRRAAPLATKAATTAGRGRRGGKRTREAGEDAKGAVAKPAKPRPSPLRALQEQWRFKGFGWSLYKSLLHPTTLGAALRIPLSANLDAYDRRLAAPYVSSALYLGHPWVLANFWMASVPLEAVRWAAGVAAWKVRWAAAACSALLRGAILAALWVVLAPYRACRAALGWIALLAGRFGPRGKRDENATEDGRATNRTEAVVIETHIELNNSSELAATTVVDGPRGGASSNGTAVPPSESSPSSSSSSSSARKRSLTLLGNEVPPFRYPHPIEYSSTIQERIGVAASWRVSQERGYEYRCHLVYTCLPTVLFWGRLEDARRRRTAAARNRLWGNGAAGRDAVVGAKEKKDVVEAPSSSSPPDGVVRSLLAFLGDHSSTVGLSSGFPLPVHPGLSLNLMLSMSGFYYGWLLHALRSLLAPTRATRSDGGDEAASAERRREESNERLVSSALKNKLPAEEGGEEEDDDDEGRAGRRTETNVAGS